MCERNSSFEKMHEKVGGCWRLKQGNCSPIIVRMDHAIYQVAIQLTCILSHFTLFFSFLGRKLHKRILAMDNHLLTSDACLNRLVPIQSWNSHWQRTISICDVVSPFCKISVYFFFFCKMGDKNCDEGPRDYEDNTL